MQLSLFVSADGIAARTSSRRQQGTRDRLDVLPERWEGRVGMQGKRRQSIVTLGYCCRSRFPTNRSPIRSLYRLHFRDGKDNVSRDDDRELWQIGRRIELTPRQFAVFGCDGNQL